VPSGPWEEKGCDFSWRSAAVRTLGLSPRGPGEEEGRFGAARALSHKGLRLDGEVQGGCLSGAPGRAVPAFPRRLGQGRSRRVPAWRGDPLGPRPQKEVPCGHSRVPGLSRQLWGSRQRSPTQDARNPRQDAHGPALPAEGPAALPKHGAAHTRRGPLRAAGQGRAGRGDGFGQTCAGLEALPRRAVTALFRAVPRQNAFAAIKYLSPLPNHP